MEANIVAKKEQNHVLTLVRQIWIWFGWLFFLTQQLMLHNMLPIDKNCLRNIDTNSFLNIITLKWKTSEEKMKFRNRLGISNMITMFRRLFAFFICNFWNFVTFFLNYLFEGIVSIYRNTYTVEVHLKMSLNLDFPSINKCLFASY